MEIIIEYVLLDNIIINYVILYLSQKILRKNIGFLRKFFPSLFGSIFSLLMPLIVLPSYIFLPIKLLIGVLMCLMCFSDKKTKNIITNFLVFLTVTACMGGFCFLVIYLFGNSLETALYGYYDMSIPMGVVFIILALYIYIMCELIEYFYKRKKFNNFVFSVKFKNEDKEAIANAFLDSGNTLIDPITNKPVIIINYSLFQKLFPIPMDKLLTKKITESDIKNSHYIDYGTISMTKNKILVFPVEKIAIDLSSEVVEHKNVMLGLTFSKIQSAFKCDALLSPHLF